MNGSYHYDIDAPDGAVIDKFLQKYDTVSFDMSGIVNVVGEITSNYDVTATDTDNDGIGEATTYFDPANYQAQILKIQNPNYDGSNDFYLDLNPSSSVFEDSFVIKAPDNLRPTAFVETQYEMNGAVTLEGKVTAGYTVKLYATKFDGDQIGLSFGEHTPTDDDFDGFGEWSRSLDPTVYETLDIRLSNSNGDIIDLNEDPNLYMLNVEII